jgi:hypothetical protein
MNDSSRPRYRRLAVRGLLLVVAITFLAGLLIPAMQPAKESNCGEYFRWRDAMKNLQAEQEQDARPATDDHPPQR